MKKLILFGPPGAGKGTFSSQIIKVLPNIVHISTGDLFRYNLKNQTPIGLEAKKYMDKGALVPDEVVIGMVQDKLNQDDVKKNGFILDGFPRTLKQAQALSEITQIDTLLLLDVPRNVITKRILGRYSCKKCGAIYNKYTLPPKKEGVCDNCGAEIKFEQRSDDTEETLKKRLDVYEENAKPLIQYYEKNNAVKKVNAENTLKLTEEEIKNIIEI